jgi:hypothetical protein
MAGVEMGRTIGNLTALSVQRVTEPGLYSDRGHDAARGLYLQVTRGKDGQPKKSWLYRYSIAGRAREMGLGSLAAVSLAEARVKARKQRGLREEGIDPIEARKAAQAGARLANAHAMTFDACSVAYAQAHGNSWRNSKHRAQWSSSLSTYASPVFGSNGYPPSRT